MFPEGGMIYGFLAVYMILGAALMVVVGRLPQERGAA
jgi:hypothetical protein